MDYELQRSARARRVRISVHHDGCVVVIAPQRVSERLIKIFVAEHREWIETQRARMERRGPIIDLRGSPADFKKHKKIALEFVTAKVAELNVQYNFAFKKISVRNARGRWGSCSSDGRLAFNYRLIKIPSELADYIVAHELAHLAEHNHGARFWALVARAIPDYKVRRKKLRAFVL